MNAIQSETLHIKSYNIYSDVSKSMKKFHDSRYLNYLKKHSLKEYRLMVMKNEFLKIEDSTAFALEKEADTTICYQNNEDENESIFSFMENNIITFDTEAKCDISSDQIDFTDLFSDESENDDSDDSSRSCPSDDENFVERFSTYGIDTDAPMFPLLWPHIKLITSGTLKATYDLMNKDNRIVIHFSGGRHHARKDRAAGYCYINDVVLSAFQLAKKHKKVLIIDIDIHHGDGTQEAFYYSSQVMTISFHQFGRGLYPGTGEVTEIGEGKGRGYNINIPLKDGINDNNFMELFKVIVTRSVETFMPDYIIFVCGADALSRDRLGVGNLTTRSYEFCSLFFVDILKRYSHMKLLVTGAGGYNIPDTIRVWSVVTAAFCNEKADSLPLSIPEFSGYHLFKPDFNLHTSAERVRDRNSPEYLTELRKFILSCLEQSNNVSI